MKLYRDNCDISLSLQIDSSLNFLTQSTQSMQTILKYNNSITYANIMAIIKDFVVSSRIHYTCIALN